MNKLVLRTLPNTTRLATRCASTFPTVSETLVNVTFVDYKGDRETVLGRVGQNLLQVADVHNLTCIADDSNYGGAVETIVHNEEWTEDLFGEGPQSNLAHVIVAEDWINKLPEMTDGEKQRLSEMDEGVTDFRSRLATEVVLTKELDGITVYVPDWLPIDMA